MRPPTRYAAEMSPLPSIRRAIVAFPQIETDLEWRRVLSFRERHDPLARSIAPHVTLVFPFEDRVSNELLEVEVGDALRRLAAFRVVLRGISVHENEYLFLNVKRGNDAIVELHDTLYRGVLAVHRSRFHTFVPHITVGRVGLAGLAAALDASAACDGEIIGIVDRVSLYEISPVGARSIAFEVSLGER
jgi:2'-5' RNA ligase